MKCLDVHMEVSNRSRELVLLLYTALLRPFVSITNAPKFKKRLKNR